MKKIELHKDNRIKRIENYVVLKSIENKISEKIRKEFEGETLDIRLENDTLFKQEKEFINQAKEFLTKITPQTSLRVKTQVGKDSDVIQQYEGHIEKTFRMYDSTLNFICKDFLDGKPFTIGFSCLQSIEII